MKGYADEYDCYELFGGCEEKWAKASAILSENLAILESIPCLHKQKEVFADGSGYCVECGLSFDKDNSSNIGECKHENKYEDDTGMTVCSNCKMEFEDLNFEQEWKYYNDTNFDGKDPSRCHKTRTTGKNLGDVFSETGWEPSPAIKAGIQIKYNKIVKGDTIRGKKRKAIIAVCLFYVNMEFGEYRTSDFIRKMFKLTKKEMSSGLTTYHAVFPESRTKEIKPSNLIKWILSLVGIPDEHYRKIKIITSYMEDASVLLKRSSPQSVASAVIYFYLCLNMPLKSSLKLTKNRFAEKVLLSDITVTKLVKEASLVSETIIIM